MKIKFLILASFLFFISNTIKAQSVGTKKEITLKLVEYFCSEDDCFIELKEIKTGKIYDFYNIDEKTKDNGIIKEIQDLYFKNENNIKTFIGKNYRATLEYRKTDEYKSEWGTDAPPYKTGKKIYKWMINKLSEQ